MNVLENEKFSLELVTNIYFFEGVQQWSIYVLITCKALSIILSI
jgi:hypothetical protein